MPVNATFTLTATPYETEVQQFDGRKVVRVYDIAADDTLQNTVNHEITSNGITRSLVKLDRFFSNATSGEAEQCSAHFVLTYLSGEGKTKAKELADALADWLIANSGQNLDSIGAKLYGED